MNAVAGYRINHAFGGLAPLIEQFGDAGSWRAPRIDLPLNPEADALAENWRQCRIRDAPPRSKTERGGRCGVVMAADAPAR